MTRILPLIAIATMSAAAPASAQGASLESVAAHLGAVRSMTAEFVQVDRSGRALPGKLILKRPGKVRFQYAPGNPLLIVGDGNWLTMIDYSVRQVSRWPVGNSPLSVLTNPRADLARFARIIPAAAGQVALEARDPKHPEHGTITLVFGRDGSAPAGLRLDGWTVIDAQGNRSVVRLSNQLFNVAVSDAAFRWRDPRAAGPRR